MGGNAYLLEVNVIKKIHFYAFLIVSFINLGFAFHYFSLIQHYHFSGYILWFYFLGVILFTVAAWLALIWVACANPRFRKKHFDSTVFNHFSILIFIGFLMFFGFEIVNHVITHVTRIA